MARDLTKINLNFPTEMLLRLDEYAEKMGITRTAAINVLVSQGLDQQKTIHMMGDLMHEYNQRKIGEK